MKRLPRYEVAFAAVVLVIAFALCGMLTAALASELHDPSPDWSWR